MDKKTIIGIVLMSLIFIGYVIFNSKQQAEYQEYLEQVQTQEQALAETQATAESLLESNAADDPATALSEAEAAQQREISMFGQSLIDAKAATAQSVKLENDYLTAEFTTRGAVMQKVVLADYTKFAPRTSAPRRLFCSIPRRQLSIWSSTSRAVSTV